MYSDLFSQKSVQDLLTVLPSLPLAVWETFYVTVVSTAPMLPVSRRPTGICRTETADMSLHWTAYICTAQRRMHRFWS